jgi:hypothetical protein
MEAGRRVQVDISAHVGEDVVFSEVVTPYCIVKGRSMAVVRATQVQLLKAGLCSKA